MDKCYDGNKIAVGEIDVSIFHMAIMEYVTFGPQFTESRSH